MSVTQQRCRKLFVVSPQAFIDDVCSYGPQRAMASVSAAAVACLSAAVPVQGPQGSTNTSRIVPPPHMPLRISTLRIVVAMQELQCCSVCSVPLPSSPHATIFPPFPQHSAILRCQSPAQRPGGGGMAFPRPMEKPRVPSGIRGS